MLWYAEANTMKEYRETAKVTLALYPFFVVAPVNMIVIHYNSIT